VELPILIYKDEIYLLVYNFWQVLVVMIMFSPFWFAQLHDVHSSWQSWKMSHFQNLARKRGEPYVLLLLWLKKLEFFTAY